MDEEDDVNVFFKKTCKREENDFLKNLNIFLFGIQFFFFGLVWFLYICIHIEFEIICRSLSVKDLLNMMTYSYLLLK